MAKISIDQIASWRAGELLTEKKLQMIFTLIGETINKSDEQYQRLIVELNALHLASRWIGECATFKSIDAYIVSISSLPVFQPPNKKVPSNGDVLYVNNNSDDPNLPVDLNPGRYLYIYTSNADGSNPKWSLYNPYSQINASEFNDGLMSKEMFIKLNGLPDGASLEENLKLLNDNYTKMRVDVDSNTSTTTSNKGKIDNIIPRVTNLEIEKQNRITTENGVPLKNYTTGTVTENLVEVGEKVKIVSEQNIVIWQPTLGEPPKTGISLINVDLPEDELVLNNYIKFYFSIDDTADIAITAKVSNLNATYKASEVCIINDIKYIITVSYLRGVISISTLSLDGALAAKLTFTLNKVIKDLGISDYLWPKIIEEEITDFLNNNLGVKKSHILSNIRPDGFNGFRAGDVYTLSNSYIYGANSCSLYIGGILLNQGAEWREKSIGDPIYSNQIEFLQDVNISRDGTISIICMAMVLNNFQVLVWNKDDTYATGGVVLHSSVMWYAKFPNTNSEPTESNSDWALLQTNVDISGLEAEIKRYVSEVANALFNNLPTILVYSKTKMDEVLAVQLAEIDGKIINKVDTTTFNESQDAQDREIAKKQHIEEWKVGSCIYNPDETFTFNFNVVDTKRVQITILQDYRSINYLSPIFHIDMDLNDVWNVAKGFYITQYGYDVSYSIRFFKLKDDLMNRFRAGYQGTPSQRPRPQDIIIKYLLKNETIDDSNKNIIGFKSYSEYGSGLKILNCRLNQITGLGLSNNINLMELDCTYNQITSLDLSNNTKLLRLFCAENQITSLDLSNNTNLTFLECLNNPNLTTVKISQTLQDTISITKDKHTTIEWV